MMVVYVNDVPMSEDRDKLLPLVINYFKRSFEVRMDPKIERCPGFSVQDDENVVKLHIGSTMRRFLEALRMQDCKPAKNPLPKELELLANESEDLSDATPLRQLIGALHHLANTE